MDAPRPEAACTLCGPKPVRDDLAPSPIHPASSDSFIGKLSELHRSKCPRCLSISKGVEHFASLLRPTDAIRRDAVLVECASRVDTDYMEFRATQQRGATSGASPRSIEISFRFLDMPSAGVVQLRCITVGNILTKPASLARETHNSLTQIKVWADRCDHEHVGKCTPKEPKELPSRLLLIHDDVIQLVDARTLSAGGSKARPKSLKYVALSHCWGQGGEHQVKTTTGNLQDMRNGFPIAALPRTARDAVTIAKFLGIRFIWIDSFCIIQDDKLDWESESARMAEIYTNALLTVAASRSHDGNGGCFSSIRDTPYIWRRMANWHPDDSVAAMSQQPVLLKDKRLWSHYWHVQGNVSHVFMLRQGHDIRDLSHTAVLGDNAVDVIKYGYPLLSRAWFFQERLLSPRVVHFGHAEIIWECRCAFWTRNYGVKMYRPEKQLEWSEIEDNYDDGDDGSYSFANMTRKARQPARKPKPPEIFPIEKTRRQLIALETQSGPSSIQDIRKLWHRLVEEYTRLDITHEMDRLPALSGIATLLSRMMAGGYDQDPAYLAGIWSSHLPSALYWTSSGAAHRTFAYRAPTFSWVSIEGPITYHEPLSSDEAGYVACEVLDYSSVTDGLDRHGTVSGGYIQLRGYTGYATVARMRGPATCMLASDRTTNSWQVFELDASIRLCASPPAEVQVGDQLLLLMLECSKAKDLVSGYRYRMKVLVLRASQKEPDAWQRVGMAVTPQYAYQYPDAEVASMFYSPSPWVPEKRVVKIV